MLLLFLHHTNPTALFKMLSVTTCGEKWWFMFSKKCRYIFNVFMLKVAQQNSDAHTTCKKISNCNVIVLNIMNYTNKQLVTKLESIAGSKINTLTYDNGKCFGKLTDVSTNKAGLQCKHLWLDKLKYGTS